VEQGGDKVVVAFGTINVPVVQVGTIHSVPIPPGHARVTVDGVCDAELLTTPLPVPLGEQEILQDALGSFAAWPISMILMLSDEVYHY
jgi:hypothetical protein